MLLNTLLHDLLIRRQKVNVKIDSPFSACSVPWAHPSILEPPPERNEVARADAAIIKYLANLSALFYWHLTAFFDRNFNALLGGDLPATHLRNLKQGE